MQALLGIGSLNGTTETSSRAKQFDRHYREQWHLGAIQPAPLLRVGLLSLVAIENNEN